MIYTIWSAKMRIVALSAALTPSWVLIGAVQTRSIVPDMHFFHALRAQRKRQRRHISSRHLELIKCLMLIIT